MTCELGDMVEFCARPARKDHVCVECYNVISKGTTHQVVTGLWDGEFRTYRTCARCADLRDRINRGHKLQFEDLLAFGELMEYIAECTRI